MFLPILAALLPSQASPVGHWTGVWIKAGDRLAVSVDFRKTDSGYAGSFDSDGLQVAGIPFSKVEFVEGKLLFTLRGDQTSIEFEGTLANNALEGKLAENGVQGTFQLAPRRLL
jgi:hypothetical protein